LDSIILNYAESLRQINIAIKRGNGKYFRHCDLREIPRAAYNAASLTILFFSIVIIYEQFIIDYFIAGVFGTVFDSFVVIPVLS